VTNLNSGTSAGRQPSGGGRNGPYRGFPVSSIADFSIWAAQSRRAPFCPTCTTSASLNRNPVLLGNGSEAINIVGSLGSTTTVLHGNGRGMAFGSVALTTDVTGISRYQPQQRDSGFKRYVLAGVERGLRLRSGTVTSITPAPIGPGTSTDGHGRLRHCRHQRF
jgi:hypothetical protein